MSWEFTDDVEVYRAHVWDLLALRPAENTVALTVIENVRGGRRWSAEPMLFGWAGSPVRGAASMTPPFELLLAEVPDHDLDDLATALRARGAVVPGVTGPTAGAERFAAAWTGDGRTATVTRDLRLYSLDSLQVPPPPGGSARPAVAADSTDVLRLWRPFLEEAGMPTFGLESTVRGRIDDGLVWVWADSAGVLVSLAARNEAAGAARIGPVYTAPELRRRGYGAAVTAACAADALERGVDAVVLFTDLANPTSNAIYQQIGFRPVHDHRTIAFGAPAI